MVMTEKVKFEKVSFGERMGSMLSVDFRRMFTMPLLYVMAGVCFAIPILTLVMTTMMGGSAPADAAAGTASDTFTKVWQAIGSVSSENAMMNMSLTGMCNINMLYFFLAVFVCTFIADDFRSGYSKNLFAVRSKKADYVISKTLAGFVGGAVMLLSYFAGAMIGGAIAGLPFDMGEAGIGGITMCMVAKVLLVAVFAPMDLLMSVIGKQKLWLSLIGSLCICMLLFTMIPMLTPLDSGMMNVILCLAGGILFSAGLGTVSNVILAKTSLV